MEFTAAYFGDSGPQPVGRPTHVAYVLRAPRSPEGGSGVFLMMSDRADRLVVVTGTIHDVFGADGTRHEVVMHGPSAPKDRRAVVAGFLLFDEAIGWPRLLASMWLDHYWTPGAYTP